MRWTDLAPAARTRLAADGVVEATFASWLDRVQAVTERRMIDGSFDHLVYYALQSRRLSPAPPIEPALSARTFVETLGRARVPDDAAARLDALARALARDAARGGRDGKNHIDATDVPNTNSALGAGGGAAADGAVPRKQDDSGGPAASSRVVDTAAGARLQHGGNNEVDSGARLALCRHIIANAGLGRASQAKLRARLEAEYRRAMAFLYDKEFVAARATDSREATATLYHTRAHSTDTQMEAGFAVAEAIATLKALAPATRISRVLIAGPGLDVAPRTGLLEELPPQSYQPFAVADALLSSGLSDRATLRLDIVDINPLVVQHFETLARGAARAAGAAAVATPSIIILSGWRDDARTRLSEAFRRYVAHWGDAIRAAGREERGAADGKTAREASGAVNGVSSGSAVPPTSAVTQAAADRQDGLRERGLPGLLAALGARRVPIATDIAAAIHARRANIVTDRLAADGARYDLVVITNVLPYLSDTELTIALSNVAQALAPGGAFIHNEPRRTLLAASTAIGLPAVQSRTVQIAAPAGGAPIFDTILLHRKP